MKKSLLYFTITISCLLLHYNNADAQVKNKTSSPKIEIMPFKRWDSYPEFSYVLNGRPSTDYIKLDGASPGIMVFYKYPLQNGVYIKGGIGYYKYTFDKIIKNNTFSGISNARDIDYYAGPIAVDIPYYTDNYWYNTVSINIGIEKSFDIKNNMFISAGAIFSNYFTFSQNYQLKYNPMGNLDYRKDNKRYFGYSANLNISGLKKINKFIIGPTLIIPVLNSWKTDDTFPEEINSNSRDKWFQSFGAGILLNYSLNKIKSR